MSEGMFDAIVAGCGPVGAVAANLLGRRGISTLVIEQNHEPYVLPRAIHFDAEIMRVLQSAGLAERILPHLFTPRASVHFGADGGVIRMLSMRGGKGRNGWASNYMFYQPELEATLRDSLSRWRHVRTQFGAAVAAVKQDTTGVEVTVRRTDGTPHTYRTRYLLACDGASSSVRKQLGITLEDLQFEEPWLVIDADVDGELSLPPDAFQAHDIDLRQTSVMICDPRRPSTVIPGRGNHRRWEFMVLPGETEEHMLRTSTIQSLLAPWVVNAKCTVIRAAVYRFHGLLARRWQVGRVFLLGDAAHQTPPFYGQGLCHGVRDAANLAWKLELVLRSQAAPTMLDSYEPERVPQVRHAVEASVAAGRYICTLDPVQARERDERMRTALQSAAAEMFFQVAPLTGGVIALRGVPGQHGVGTLFIQPRVRMPDGRELLLDDATGGGFVLLTRRSDPLTGVAPEILEFWKRLGGTTVQVTGAADSAAASAVLRVADESGEIGAWLSHHEVEAVIVRPDAYVFAALPRLEMLTETLQQLHSALHWSGAGAARSAHHEEVA
jgi:3-(3-hydroxy-phenyl)propionate hydroxylase